MSREIINLSQTVSSIYKTSISKNTWKFYAMSKTKQIQFIFKFSATGEINSLKKNSRLPFCKNITSINIIHFSLNIIIISININTLMCLLNIMFMCRMIITTPKSTITYLYSSYVSLNVTLTSYSIFILACFFVVCFVSSESCYKS